MKRRSGGAVGLLLIIASCAPASQVSAPTPTAAALASPAPRAAVVTPSSTPAAAPSAEEFDWRARVAPIRHFELPKHPNADLEWAIGPPIGPDSVLMVMSAGPRRGLDRAAVVYDLARYDLATSAITTLVRPPAGTGGVPIVAGRTAAWVERSLTDLRAYGWRIHVTDVSTGADRVVARDPGFRPPDVQSVLPAFAFDGSAIVYTTLAEIDGKLRWQLRRLRVSDASDEVIAELPDPGRQDFNRVGFDDRAVIWTERAYLQPEPRQTIGIYDITSRTTTRRESPLRNVYAIVLAGERLFLGTGSGLFETDRRIARQPVRLSQDAFAVDQVGVSGRFLLYSSHGPGEPLYAIDLESGGRARLATGVTTGPEIANGTVLWFERAQGSTPGRSGLSVVDPAGSR